MVSDILDNLFPNVTLYVIDKSLPLFVGSLPGGHEQHTKTEGGNYFTSQARVEINILDLYSK